VAFSAQIKALFRLFLLLTVLVAVALISAITTIRLTIHGHQETMPSLVGRSADSAQRLGSGLGLDFIVEGKAYNPKYPADQVVSQEPPAGTRIKVGQHVHVLVSLGAPRVQIPNVVGASGRAAEITAVQRGLSIGDVVAVYWPAASTGEAEEKDVVVAQEPLASAAEVHSPAMNFLVSLGPLTLAYACPDFVGRPVEEARRTIGAAGFKVGQVTQIPTNAAAVGTILTQSPAPGSKITPGAAFVFQVAAPPANPPMAPVAPPSNPPRPGSPPSVKG